MNRRRNWRRWTTLALFFFGFLVFAAFAVYRLSGLSAADCRELDAARIQAIAYLENGKENLADPLWDRMAARLPGEPLVARNRALGRLLALSKDRRAESLAAASAAVAVAKTVEQQTWVPLGIEGRLELSKKDLPSEPAQQDAHLSAALDAFSAAARLAPDQAIPRYEQYQASKLSTMEAEVAAGRLALAEAYRLDPANLFIALDWLEVAAETRDAGFVPAVAQFLKTLRPLLPGLKRRTRIDVEPFVQQAVDLSAQGQWPQAAGIVRRLGFVRAEDVAQSDYRRILPNPLELVLHQFRAVRCDPPPPAAVPAIAVRFATQRIAGAVSPAAGSPAAGAPAAGSPAGDA